MKSKKKHVLFFPEQLLVTAICALAAGFTGFPQGTLTGIVTDKVTGKPLQGAHVTLENTFLSTSAEPDGRYILYNVKPGRTGLTVSFVGYETIRTGFVFHRDTVIDFAMSPAAILGEEVNIVATRAQSKTPVTYTTIGEIQISKVNLGKDLPYLLQNSPSVVVTSDAGTGIGYTGISIRGTDLTRINVTINGIPLNDAESQGVWFVDLPDLASSSRNIQIQRGVGTSTNGAGAFGATINIQTQSLSQDPYGELDVSGGSYATLKSTLRFGTGLLANKIAIDGRVSYITSDGYIDRAFSKLKSFLLAAGYYGKNTTLKLNVMSGLEKTYQAWEGVPEDSLSTNRTYNPAGEYTDPSGQTAYYGNQTDNYQQDHYQLLFSQGIGNEFNVNAAIHFTKGRGYYESYKPHQSFTDYGLQEVVIGQDTIKKSDMITRKMMDNDFFGFTFSGNYHRGEFVKITLGGAWNRYYGEHFGKIIWAQYASDGTNGRNWYYNTGLKNDFNIYAKASLLLLKRLTLFADFQYRYVSYRMEGELDDLREIDQDHIFNFFNPKCGIYWDIADRHQAYFSFAVANREPSRNNYKDADPDHMPVEETLFDYELGYDLRLRDFLAGINLYYMNYHDQLVLTGEINNVGEAVMTNVPHSYRAGIEITAAATIFKWLKWDFTGTLSRNRIRDFTEYVDRYDTLWNFTGQVSRYLGETDLSFSPNLVLTNAFTFLPVKNLSVAILSKYIGRQFIDNTSSKARSLDPCFINGIAAEYILRTKFIKEIGFRAQVNNLFSERYESNAWVYRYYSGPSEYEMNGYFPQALINFLLGITLRI
jgi:iron complex outermembrane receptor protein